MDQKAGSEIGGAGMIHPNVFDSVNYDSDQYGGYAFGFGLDRMAMLLYDLSDLESFFGESQLSLTVSFNHSLITQLEKKNVTLKKMAQSLCTNR